MLTRAFMVSILAQLTCGSRVWAQEQNITATRDIRAIPGDLYLARDGDDVTVFLVTPDGIILGDPLNLAFANWLKGELDKRFPNQPVRYVLYSHHHFERASGGAVFNDTADLIGHEDFDDELFKARGSLRHVLAKLDLNKNGELESAEISGAPMARAILSRDLGSDLRVSPEELYRDVVPVEGTYASQRTITLGGRSVQLIHPGVAHAADMTVLYFPTQRVLFAVDFLPVRTLPYDLGPTNTTRVITSLKALEAIDFQEVISGNGDLGTKADVEAYRQYVEVLGTNVRDALRAGRPVQEIQASLNLKDYSGWRNYALQRNANIAEIYNRFHVVNTSLYGAAQINGLQRRPVPGACRTTPPLPQCYGNGGTVFSGTVGFKVSGKHAAVLGEISSGQYLRGHARNGTAIGSVDYTLDHKDSVLAGLLFYSLPPTGPITLSIGGGPSMVITSEQETQVTSNVRGQAQSFTRNLTEKKLSFTSGLDVSVSLGTHARVVFPLRATRVGRSPAQASFYGLGGWIVHAGVGIAADVARSVR